MSNPVKLIHIVAYAKKNHCIGDENKLPWHLPSDLKFFKEQTHNNIVVMGRKTFSSIGRVLPNRDNIIVSRDHSLKIDGAIVLNSLETAISYAKSLAKSHNKKKVFIIGGADIYQQTSNMVDQIEATVVDLDVKGDSHYPSIDMTRYHLTNESNHIDSSSGISYKRQTYTTTPLVEA